MRAIRITSGLILVLVLASCATTPGEVSTRPSLPSPDFSVSPEEQNLTSLLALASNSSSPMSEQYYLEAARFLIELNRQDEAIDILNTLNTENLELTLATDIWLEQAQFYVSSNQSELALSILISPRLTVLPQLSDSQRIAVRLTRAQAYLESSNFLASAKERIYANKLLPGNARAENHERIWQSLIAMPAAQLQALVENEINFEFLGWYELGVIGKAYQYNLDRQLVELEKWRQTKTRHPASRYLPQALLLVETMARERPDNIALLLPLETSAGKVVRDGFMSAYFNVKAIGGKVPSLTFYDTSTTTNISELHRQAMEDGAGMIIGPLLKQNVAELQQKENLGVVTLALNNVDGAVVSSAQTITSSNSEMFYQFALSPENEAQQIATMAWKNGHRNAAILSPQDESGNDAYTRKRNSFIQQWREFGGQIVAQEIFLENYTDTIEALLDLSDSEYRKESLSELIGESLEFTQRRRQDVDVIFLIAQPGDARQINPRLSYLYAGDIPVYGSQDVYSGISSPLEDTDLNGIIFSDSPWILADNDDLKLETQALFPQTSARNLRLQAFGIDAFRLYPRLKQLDSVPDTQIYGATGLLTLGRDRNINRELSWARIEDGDAKLINPGD
jgi:uncharacterized protein